jgi:hypothetical protein
MKKLVERNMYNLNGKKLENDFIMVDDDATYYKSEDKIIVKITEDEVFIDDKYGWINEHVVKCRDLFLGLYKHRPTLIIIMEKI